MKFQTALLLAAVLPVSGWNAAPALALRVPLAPLAARARCALPNLCAAETPGPKGLISEVTSSFTSSEELSLGAARSMIMGVAAVYGTNYALVKSLDDCDALYDAT